MDPQLQASKNIQVQLLKEGVNVGAPRALFLIGPGVAHRWNPETHKISERFVDEAAARGIETPPISASSRTQRDSTVAFG